MGHVAARLRATPEGIQVTDRLLQPQTEQVNETYARETAQALRAETSADIALAVVSTMGDQDMYKADTGKTCIAIVTADAARAFTYPVGGMGEMAQNWTAVRALDILRRALL